VLDLGFISIGQLADKTTQQSVGVGDRLLGGRGIGANSDVAKIGWREEIHERRDACRDRCESSLKARSKCIVERQEYAAVSFSSAGVFGHAGEREGDALAGNRPPVIS
jgi:hypothetical protein